VLQETSARKPKLLRVAIFLQDLSWEGRHCAFGNVTCAVVWVGLKLDDFNQFARRGLNYTAVGSVAFNVIGRGAKGSPRHSRDFFETIEEIRRRRNLAFFEFLAGWEGCKLKVARR